MDIAPWDAVVRPARRPGTNHRKTRNRAGERPDNNLEMTNMKAAIERFERSTPAPAFSAGLDVASLVALLDVVARLPRVAEVPSGAHSVAGSAADNVVALVSHRDDVTPSQGTGVAHARALRPASQPADQTGSPLELLLHGLSAYLSAGATPAAANDSKPGARTYPFGKAVLDLDAAKLTGLDGREIPLTAMEFSLLKLFAKNRGRVLNRDQILEGAHDRSWDPFDRSIDIRISRIRKKIEVNPRKPEVIRTVRGIGYIYDPSR